MNTPTLPLDARRFSIYACQLVAANLPLSELLALRRWSWTPHDTHFITHLLPGEGVTFDSGAVIVERVR
jgi:hypothetical protein